MHRRRLTVPCLMILLWLVYPCSGKAQEPDETPPLEDKQAASQRHEPTATELSRSETLASAMVRTFEYEEYEFRSAAEAMPAEKYGYRPASGDYGGIFPGYGPKELRTFAEQVKHVACANFAFSAELEGITPPPACDKGEPLALKARAEILTYLRDSFVALKKSLNAINDKNKFDPVEGPYAGPNTRLGMAGVAIWHVSDHYGQVVIYLRMNGIVPPASRPESPKLQEKY